MAPEAWINYIFTITVGAAGIIYLFVALSFLKLRKTHPEWHRPYMCPWGTFMGIESVLFCVYCLYECVKVMDVATWVVLGIYFAIGAILYVYAKYKQKTDPAEWHPFIQSPDNTQV